MISSKICGPDRAHLKAAPRVVKKCRSWLQILDTSKTCSTKGDTRKLGERLFVGSEKFGPGYRERDLDDSDHLLDNLLKTPQEHRKSPQRVATNFGRG